MSLAILNGKSESLRQQLYNTIGSEEAAAAQRVLESRNLSGFLGRAGEGFLGGPEVRALEDAFAKEFGVKYAISFNSATTALQGAVAAVGIGPGDEVITSPFSMTATPASILLNGAVPVFADISDETFCLDAESVKSRITPRTRAILPVNLFGGSPDYDALRKIADEHSLSIIEDNAQGPGATYRGRKLGTIGDIGVFSLNVHKVIQCGEGGIAITNDEGLANRLRLVRNHGEAIVDDEGGSEPIIGSNYRLSEVHAAIAGVQLAKLEAFNVARQTLVAQLTKGLRRFSWLVPTEPPAHVSQVWYIYPFRYMADRLGGISRSTIARTLVAEGFPVAEGYVKPLYLQPVYQQKRMYPRSQFPFVSTEFPSDVSYDRGLCSVAERLWEHELLTTAVFHPPNTEETVEAFLEVLSRIEAHTTDLLAFERTLG
jgi:dTDP-4-amino-4,6-dideoxygalactose transaminase